MSEQTVFITGGTGLLGKALLETIPAGVRVFATYHRRLPPAAWRDFFLPLDLCQQASIDSLFEKVKPDTVIHTASIGEVDEAERHLDSVRAVNVEGTQKVLQSCRQSNACFIFISSNAVFDGTHPPYREEAPLRAVNQYGQMKIAAEQLVSASGVPHLIVRPILMYGWPLEGGRENAVTRWLTSFEKSEPVRVAEEIVTMPLWVVDCARTIWIGLLQRKEGIVHVAGADRVTMVQFAKEVCRLFNHDERLIRSVPSREFAHLAPRPRDTSFDLTRLRLEFKIEPLGIHEGLTQMCQGRAVTLSKALSP